MNKRKRSGTVKHNRSSQSSREQYDSKLSQVDTQELEKLPSVEWGERIDSGKAIARGGKDTGFVPGAMPHTSKG